MRTLACCCRVPADYVAQAALDWLQKEAEQAWLFWEEMEARAELVMRITYCRPCWDAWLLADLPYLEDSESSNDDRLRRPPARPRERIRFADIRLTMS